MKPNLFKIILIALGLLISPIVIASLLGGMYVVILLISGQSFNQSYDALLLVIHGIRPYIHYLTGIPIVLVVLVKIIIPLFKKKK